MRSIDSLSPDDQAAALEAVKTFAAWYRLRQENGIATSLSDTAAFLQQLAPGVVASTALMEITKAGHVQLGVGNRARRRGLSVIQGGKA